MRRAGASERGISLDPARGGPTIVRLNDGRSWRNWQTRQLQELVPVREWRFESSRPHQPFAALSCLLSSDSSSNRVVRMNYIRITGGRIVDGTGAPGRSVYGCGKRG